MRLCHFAHTPAGAAGNAGLGVLNQSRETARMRSRRHFIRIVPAAATAMLGLPAVRAQSADMVNERDGQATALGYVADAARVDRAKHKQYAAGQNCATCALYQGKAGDAAGPCPLYGSKRVAAKGWCTAWAKKA